MKTVTTIFLMTAALMGPFASASIGLDASTISTDCTQLNGTYSVVTAGSEYQCSAKNLTVEFYTDSQNVVTRISWKGRRTPALSVLLGSFSSEYSAAYAAASHIGAKRIVHDETKNVVVTRGGNARFHVGEIDLKPTAQ
jgi:membrane-bound inhibitor of C-type lysozyme